MKYQDSPADPADYLPPQPPEVLFTLTVYKDGTVSVWASKDISTHDFGEAVIAVGEAFRDNVVDMIAGGDLP